MTDNSDSKLTKPRFLVCEDGSEYFARFARFLGEQFEFIPSRDGRTLMAHIGRHHPVCGILLDLDFRRTPEAQLLDSEGQPISQLRGDERARIVANQGIAILTALRKMPSATMVLLFADIEDRRQIDYLSRRFAPLEIIGSHVSLKEIEQRLVALALAGC